MTPGGGDILSENLRKRALVVPTPVPRGPDGIENSEMTPMSSWSPEADDLR